MLQTIHDKIHGWVAYVILGAIALVFVLWGINWTFGAPNYAAKVNGSEISVNDVREAYQRQLAQAERASNGGLDEARRGAIKQHVLDDFVSGESLLTRVEALGYRVSDADLLKAMAQIPAFQVDGKFDQGRAVAVLKAQGRSVAEVEGLIRRQVQLEQLDAAMRDTSFATDAELKRLRALTRQQRDLAFERGQRGNGTAADVQTHAAPANSRPIHNPNLRRLRSPALHGMKQLPQRLHSIENSRRGLADHRGIVGSHNKHVAFVVSLRRKL